MRWCAAWKVTLSGSVDLEFVIVAEDQRSVIEGNRPATRKSPVTPERTGAGNDVAVIFDDDPRRAQPWIAHQPRAPRSAGADPHSHRNPSSLLTNSVIGLGERGRVLLISIWLAGLGARMLAQAFPRYGCVRSGGGGMRALAPWCPAGSDWTATDVVAEYADEVGDDLRLSGSTSRVNDHWATGAYARTTHAGPRMRNHVRTPILSSCTPCSRCSRTPTSSTRARQDQRCSAGSSTSTMKSTANPGGPCTRPRLPGRRVSSAQSTRGNLRGPLRPTGGVDVPIPHCLRCERAGSRHGEFHRESVAEASGWSRRRAPPPPRRISGNGVGGGARCRRRWSSLSGLGGPCTRFIS